LTEIVANYYNNTLITGIDTDIDTGSEVDDIASIRHIAKLSGCSISTVSRVLNNREGVAPGTRKAVFEAIRQLEYQPSLTARGLRAKQDRLIGLAVPVSSAGAFSQIIQQAIDSTHKHGYHLLLVNTHEDPELEKNSISDLLRRNISGIVLSRVSDDSAILNKIVQRNIPIVVIDRALSRENVSNVVLDNQKAGYIAGRHLLDLGHKLLACITGPMKITLCRERLAGFCQALREERITLDRARIYEGDFKLESGIQGVRELYRQGFDFTCIWAMNDWMAFGVLKELQLRGVKVPEQVSLVGMDDTELALAVSPSLTTIHYPFDELVEKAIELLIAQIDRREKLSKTIVLEPGLTVRQSTSRRADVHGKR
jgi:LacI family transcriptional regulator